MYLYPFEPIELEYNSLAPEISEYTLCFHYNGHYKKYTERLNELVKDNPRLRTMPLEKLLGSMVEDIRFNAGGVYNHMLYFSGMTPCGSKMPEETERALSRCFGSCDEFFRRFGNTAEGLKGSGYVWLCMDRQHNLRIGTTVNQNTPDIDNLQPLLCCDVWEHAYYLDRQSCRKDYINAWFRLIDWEKVNAELCR